jgi:hypothetical protein
MSRISPQAAPAVRQIGQPARQSDGQVKGDGRAALRVRLRELHEAAGL